MFYPKAQFHLNLPCISKQMISYPFRLAISARGVQEIGRCARAPEDACRSGSWVNFIMTEPCSPFYPGNPWVFIGKSSPFMALSFRLVKYYNLPRGMMMDVHFTESDVFFSVGMAVAKKYETPTSTIPIIFFGPNVAVTCPKYSKVNMMGFCLTGNPGNIHLLVF